jgi:hypothetical protein
MDNDLTLQVHNDGRGRHQSYECELAGEVSMNDTLQWGLKQALSTTYGSSEEEAVDEMKKQIDAALAFLQSIKLEVTARTGYPTGTDPIKPQYYSA